MNRGGFSWKRALGVTKAKQRVARATGIPTTKAGRKNKMRRLATGGGCLVQIVMILLLLTVFILALFL